MFTAGCFMPFTILTAFAEIVPISGFKISYKPTAIFNVFYEK